MYEQALRGIIEFVEQDENAYVQGVMGRETAIHGTLATLTTAMAGRLDMHLGGIGLFLTILNNEMTQAMMGFIKLAAVLGYLHAKGVEIPDVTPIEAKLEIAMMEALGHEQDGED